MKTTTNAIDAIWHALKGSALETAANGKLVKLIRPFGSKKEDIIINALPISTNTPQICTVNVNIYTQALIGSLDNTRPNYSRIITLSEKATNAIKAVTSNDHYSYIETEQVIRESETNEYFINFRIIVQFLS